MAITIAKNEVSHYLSNQPPAAKAFDNLASVKGGVFIIVLVCAALPFAKHHDEAVCNASFFG